MRVQAWALSTALCLAGHPAAAQIANSYCLQNPAACAPVATAGYGAQAYGGGYGAAAAPAAPGPGILDRAAKADVYNSPGWRRMAARAAERPTSQPREARSMVIDAEATPAYSPGARVFHQKFGYGTVREVEGDKLTVAFDKAGDKNVVARYVTGADDVPF